MAIIPGSGIRPVVRSKARRPASIMAAAILLSAACPAAKRNRIPLWLLSFSYCLACLRYRAFRVLQKFRRSGRNAQYFPLWRPRICPLV
jgi:hypothetical protein